MGRLHLLTWVLPIVVSLGLLALDARPVTAATFTVTSPACDPNELINFIVVANANLEDDTIELGGCTITLTAVHSFSNGLPRIDDDNGHTLTIQNGTIQRSSAALTPAFRILQTVEGSSLTLQAVTISGGRDEGSGIQSGAGINVNGGLEPATLVLIDSTVRDNTSMGPDAWGGGISATVGTVTLINSTISGNTASATVNPGTAFGGGIFVDGVTLTITNSTISGNSAIAPGAASFSLGGGIYVASTTGTVTVSNSTISNNAVTGPAAQGGGIHRSSGSPVSVRASIVALQQSGSDCFGAISSLGSNVESVTSCNFLAAGDQQNVSAAALQLGQLLPNGGPTQTHALLPGSQAIDAVVSGCPPPATDQRGVPRPQEGNGTAPSACDVGAFERRPGTLQFSAPTYNVGEGGGSITITVTRTGGTDGAVGATVTVGGGASTATLTADYSLAGPPSFPIAFADGDAADKTFNITMNQDALDEADETVLLTLGSPNPGTLIGTPATATLTITDDDLPPTVLIASATAPEGNSGTTVASFRVTLSAASGQIVTVQAQTENGVGAGAATAGTDYTAVTQTVTFNPGETEKTIDVPVLGDVVDEVDETFTVRLSGAVNANIGTATGTGAITDDDTSQITIDDVAVVEGNGGSTPASFTVSLSTPNSRVVTVQAATANQNASAGSDYTSVNQTISFNPGETSKPLVVAVLGDAVDEVNETFAVDLTSPTNATILDLQGVGTILDDDGAPALTIVDESVVEGNAGMTNAAFTVTLLPASGQAVSVTAQTANGAGPTGAVAGLDYTATSQAIAFAPGETTKVFTVPVIGELLGENDETFLVTMSNPSNATILDGQATGTIVNDDTASVSVSDVSVAEGTGGTTTATFTVNLSLTSALTVTAVAQTSNGTATAGPDYTAVGPATVTFAPGVTTQTVIVPIVGDALDEPDETFFVTLSAPVNATLGDPQGIGTIRDDDGASGLSIGDVTISEATGAATGARFTVTLLPASGQTVTVVVQTANGTAQAGQDYTAVGPVTLTFPPSVTTQTVTVPIRDDPDVEADETFTVSLSSPVNSTIGDGQGLATIQNDDAAVNSPGDDDTDTPRKETEEQRQQRHNTNRGGKDDVYVEGNVIEVHPEANPAYVVIGNRDGLMTVVLYKDAAQSAPSIKVGDYLEADGEKIHEGLFEATDVSVK